MTKCDLGESTCKQLYEKRLAELPDESWVSQSKESLRAITREMQVYKPALVVSATYSSGQVWTLFDESQNISSDRSSLIHYTTYTSATLLISHRIKEDGLKMKRGS